MNSRISTTAVAALFFGLIGFAAAPAPVLAKFKETWAAADFELTSSCLCLPGQ